MTQYTYRWVSNAFDPEKRMSRFGITRESAHPRWLVGKYTGEPMPTESYTVAELKALGVIGVYVLEKSDD